MASKRSIGRKGEEVLVMHLGVQREYVEQRIVKEQLPVEGIVDTTRLADTGHCAGLRTTQSAGERSWAHQRGMRRRGEFEESAILPQHEPVALREFIVLAPQWIRRDADPVLLICSEALD